jgi:protein TonB
MALPQRCGDDDLHVPALRPTAMRPRAQPRPAVVDGAPLFSDLLAAAPKGRGLGLAASGLVHAGVIAALMLVPILWPVAMPETERDYVRVLIYDPPPPPPPPLPKGSSLRPAARAAARAEPVPTRPEPAFAAPVETPQAVPPQVEAEDAGSEPSGSETGSEAGVPEGMEGGVEGGVVGGVPGGVLGGVIGGTGTGDIQRVVRDYDQPPRAIRITKPLYPQAAFIKKVEGVVLLEILIDARGRVVRARVIKSVPLLDAAAIEAVGQWTFAPAIKQGQPVATLAQAPVTFRIY